MILYLVLCASCAALAMIYLNRGKGSHRLYPSLAATLCFLASMYTLGLEKGYGSDAVFSSCSGSVLLGVLAYWVALLVCWLWRGGKIKKAVALGLCAFTMPFSVLTWGIGAIVHHIFRAQFDAADAEQDARRAAWEQEKQARQQESEEEAQCWKALEEEFLRAVHSDDELCYYFAALYRAMGDAPVVERVAEGGPLRMYLERGERKYSFVAICRREILQEKDVEWAAQFALPGCKPGLVTTGTFSRRAVNAATKHGIELVDRPNMPHFIRAARRASGGSVPSMPPLLEAGGAEKKKEEADGNGEALL